MPHALPDTLTLQQLSFLLGNISSARVAQLVNEGTVEKVGQNAYATAGVPAYIKRLRERGDRSSDWQRARTELAQERAAAARLQRQERERQLLPTAEVIAFNTAVVRQATAALMALAAKLAPRLVLARDASKIEIIIRAEIAEVLERLRRLKVVVSESRGTPKHGADAA